MGLRGTLNLICFGLIQIISNLFADGHLHPWSLRAATLVATPAVGLRVYWHFAPCNSWLWKVFAFFSLLAIDDYLLIWSFNHITWLKCTFTSTTCLKRSFISISYLECHLNHISSRIYFLPGTCSYLRCDLTVASRVTLDECFTFSGVIAFIFQKFSLLLELFTLNFFPQIWRHSCMGGDDQDGKNQLGEQVGIGSLTKERTTYWWQLSFFIGPESDHWQCLSLTDSLTDWLTHSVTFSWFDWCDPGMWRWQLKTCWGCYCCWCWWWESCWQ